MDFRRAEWDHNEELGGIKYRDSWYDVRDYLLKRDPKRVEYYKAYIEFMENVFNNKSTVQINGPPREEEEPAVCQLDASNNQVHLVRPAQKAELPTNHHQPM
jgi:hypothetical protein